MNKNRYIFVSLVVIVLVIVFFALRPSQKKEEVSPTSSVATVSTLSITDVTSPASAVLAGAKNINWQTANYPANAGVNINLIRKISDSPREFTLVRTLETDTANDGQETWIPQNGENTNNLYVEVTCSNNYQFQAGCSLSSEPIKVN